MRIASSLKLLPAAFVLWSVGGEFFLTLGVPGERGRGTLLARTQGTSQLNLDGTFNGVVYYPNGNLKKRAKMVIKGAKFRVEEVAGRRRLLSGTVSATLETMKVRGVPRSVSFGEMQIDGGQKIELRPHRSGSTLKLLNRKIAGNPMFRFCSMDACACRRAILGFTCKQRPLRRR